MPALPTIVLAIVAEQISTVRTGNPQSAAAVAPDAPCALPRHGRLQDRGGAGLDIDPTKIVAGKGSEKHSPLRRRGDAVGTGTARCIEHCGWVRVRRRAHSDCRATLHALAQRLPGTGRLALQALLEQARLP